MKLKSGVLPLQLEVGRYKGVKKELRFCKVCQSKNLIEDEVHFLFHCNALKYVRKPFLREMKKEVQGYATMSDTDKLKTFLSEEYIKRFAKWLVEMYATRRSILYT